MTLAKATREASSTATWTNRQIAALGRRAQTSGD
jgi:hypothetical protein